jgi:hypothetical protein
VGPRAVLDTVVKRKIPSPRRKSNPRTPIVQPVNAFLVLFYNTREALHRFSTKNSCTNYIAHNEESATVGNLKPE